MTYSYDNYGWLSANEIAGRTTDVEPPAHGDKVVGQDYPNWTGVEWVLVPYSEPVIVPPTPVRQTILTKKEMLLRITPQEYSSIKMAASLNSEVDYFWQIFTLAENVYLDDPVTLAGFAALESGGVIAAGRASEILA